MLWMPKREEGANDTALVFAKLPSTSATLNDHVRRVAKAAKIDKPISFHCGRHTFGTMMLTLGADIYTTSKLMGHTKVEVTQIYAKIINKKKDDAVSLIDQAFA